MSLYRTFLQDKIVIENALLTRESFSLCVAAENDCSSSPCYAAATCIPSGDATPGSGYTCECPADYTGTLCADCEYLCWTRRVRNFSTNSIGVLRFSQAHLVFLSLTMLTVRGHLFNDLTMELSMITVSRSSLDSFPFTKQKIFSAGQNGDSPFAAKCWDSLK